jgi:hypothetical protein
MRLGKGLGAEFNAVPYIWLTRESIWYISKWRTAQHTHTHTTSFGPLNQLPTVPVAVWSTAWASSFLIAVIAVSNPAEGKDVRLLCFLCVV